MIQCDKQASTFRDFDLIAQMKICMQLSFNIIAQHEKIARLMRFARIDEQLLLQKQRSMMNTLRSKIDEC